MARRPTYEELEGRIAELEDKLAQRSDIHRTTPTDPGTCVAAFMSRTLLVGRRRTSSGRSFSNATRNRKSTRA